MFTVIPVQTRARDKETTEKIRAVSAKNSALVSKVEYLEDNIDRLTLITQALWELLQKKVGIKESELTTLMEEIDLRDGVLDGKITKKPRIFKSSINSTPKVEHGSRNSLQTQLPHILGHYTFKNSLRRRLALQILILLQH